MPGKPCYQNFINYARVSQLGRCFYKPKYSIITATTPAVPNKVMRFRQRWHCPRFLIVLFLILLIFDGAQAVTFFFGVSEPGNDEGLKPLNESSSSDEFEPPEDAEFKLTIEEMHSVYTFCRMLPYMEEIGKVRRSKMTRQICERLITILHPIFGKERQPS